MVPVIIAVGNGFTITFTLSVVLQLKIVVVTVYVVIPEVANVAVGLDVTALLSPVAGDQR